VTKYSLQIPLLIWTSKRYDETYPAKKAYLLANRTAKVGSDNLFESLLDMADIQYPQADLTKSIASASLKFSQRIVLLQDGTLADYDALDR